MKGRSLALSWILLFLSGVVPLDAESVIALVGGTLLDLKDQGRSRNDLEDSVVVLSGSTIKAVGRGGAVTIPENAEIMDISGKWIVPGLVDGFGALNNQAYANAYLAMGVTSLITVDGGRRGPLFESVDPGPTLYALEGVGSEPVATEALLEEIDELARTGHRVALLMYGLRPDQLRAAVARARKLSLATIGELGHTSYKEAVSSGIHAFVHTTRYSLDLAPPELARSVADQPFSDDLDSPKWRYYKYLCSLSASDSGVERHARVLGQSGVALMPTLSLLYLDLPNARNPWLNPVAELLNPKDVDAPADPTTGRHDYEPERAQAYADVASQVLVLEKAYRRGGALYLAGSATDVWGTMPGISLHTELELLVRIGLSNREAIAAATSNFSDVFGWDHLGLVEAGRAADLLVLGADPLEDIGNLKKIDKVILVGRILDRATLLEPHGR